MLLLSFLVAVAATALGVAAYAWVAANRRREVLARALAEGARTPIVRARPQAGTTAWETLRRRLAAWLPSNWIQNEALRARLVLAGYDDDYAPLVYAYARLTLMVLLPIIAAILAPPGDLALTLLYVSGGVFVAWAVPAGVLDRLARQRQEKIRRAIPDALDLLLVCVEAGISLDAAILRVARDMQGVHPDLSEELLLVVRKINAGTARSEALRGVWERTGVAELRTLVANIAQSERLGTSISKVLRVTAETMRRTRRQSAEKRASMAPLKMTLPLVLLILPALFLVVLGPTILTLFETLRGGG